MVDSAQPRLTPREREVLNMLCSGLTTYDALTEALVITPNTLHYHLENLRTKLNVTSIAQIVAYAHLHGLVDDAELEWRAGGGNAA